MVDRVIRLQVHGDGLNAWETARIAAPASLAGAIYGYSDYSERTGGFTVRRELPHAEGVLIVNLGKPIAITGGDGETVRLEQGDAFVAGAHLRPALSRSFGEQAGMHVFLPLVTLRRLLGLPMDLLRDRAVRLDALLGAEARDLGARLCDAADRSARRRPDRDIAEIARDVGWSRKHFADSIRDAVGVGPRSFRRLLRFQALMAAIDTDGPAPQWATLAQEAGYCDQPHMIREFREFSGMTPGAYHARCLPDGGGLVEG